MEKAGRGLSRAVAERGSEEDTMAHAVHPSLSAFSSRSTHRLLAALRRAAVTVACIWESWRAMRDLGAFDDRMLADIGLSRADLRDARAQPLWSDPTALLRKRRRERRRAIPRTAASFWREVHDAPPLVPEEEARATAPTAKPAQS